MHLIGKWDRTKLSQFVVLKYTTKRLNRMNIFWMKVNISCIQNARFTICQQQQLLATTPKVLETTG